VGIAPFFGGIVKEAAGENRRYRAFSLRAKDVIKFSISIGSGSIIP
jgi:hypothetical protein